MSYLHCFHCLPCYAEQLPVLRFLHVSKHYKLIEQYVPALSDITLDVQSGEFVVVVGRSGCGKSTFLNLAGAIDVPTDGVVEINGSSTAGLSDQELTVIRRSLVGFIFQFFQLLPTLSALENVELPLQLAGRKHSRQRALELLDIVGLQGLSGRQPHQLSGGQMQRVAIARALVHDPKLLLADEPLGNLDTETAEGILKLLLRVNRDLGTSIVMATHSRESMLQVDRVIQLSDGKLVDDVPAISNSGSHEVGGRTHSLG